MLYHSKNRLLGNRMRLASAILLSWTVFLARLAQSSPSPRNTNIRQIVALVDAQGRTIYVNTEQADLGFSSKGSAPRSSCTASVGRSRGLASLISQVADRHQVDPDLIHAVVNVESGCDSRAVSSKGAMGLMQLIPATARRFGVDNPFDPKQNIEGGTSYLKYLLGLFNGDLALSLAAYNAGENSVLRQGGIPPFPETKAYVRRVTSLYQRDSAFKAGSGTAAQVIVTPGLEKATREAGHSAIAPGRTSAPLYSFIDGDGVVHIEQ